MQQVLHHPFGVRAILAVAASAALGTATFAATQPENSSVWDGVYTQEQAARGALLYAEHCALCHGPNLQGTDGAPLTGVEFAGNWNGLALDLLADRIRTTMPPESPGKLSAQERADVIAHILSVGRFPSGSTELPRDSQGLAAIQFQATRP